MKNNLNFFNKKYYASDNRVIKLLLYEAELHEGLRGFNNGYFSTLSSIIGYSLNSLYIKSTEVYDFTKSNAGTVCFWQFKNEKDAILFEIESDPDKKWELINLDPRQCRGVNWRAVFWSNPFLIIIFFILIISSCGIKAFRSCSYAYIGFMLYKYLTRTYSQIDPKIILTTNMVSPISIAINEFSQELKLKTCYLEHALTSKESLHGVRYNFYIIRAEFIKTMLINHGINPLSIEVNPKYSYTFPPKLIAPKIFKTIGVCINDLDPIEDIRDLVVELSLRNKTIVLRLHDSDFRISAFKKMTSELNVLLELAGSRRISKFLENIDFLFAGNSSVLFDSILQGIPVGYYWKKDSELYDYYGIVTSIGLPAVKNLNDIDAAFSFYTKDHASTC